MTVGLMGRRWNPSSWANRHHLGFLYLPNNLRQSLTRSPFCAVRVVFERIDGLERSGIEPSKRRSRLKKGQINTGAVLITSEQISKTLELLGGSSDQTVGWEIGELQGGCHLLLHQVRTQGEV